MASFLGAQLHADVCGTSATRFSSSRTVKVLRSGTATNRHVLYTFPPLSVLSQLKDDQLAKVPNFVVGRHGYGQIMFLGTTDLRGVDIESSVRFVRGGFTVYPEGSRKPAVGQGLNRPAIITLNKMFPKRSTNMLEFERKMSSAIKNAVHIDYSQATGTWIFKMHHF